MAISNTKSTLGSMTGSQGIVFLIALAALIGLVFLGFNIAWNYGVAALGLPKLTFVQSSLVFVAARALVPMPNFKKKD